jgi:CubicO group peptidase (beta-lactamase class C family)
MKRAVPSRPGVRIWIPALLILSLLGCGTTPTTAPSTSLFDTDLSRELHREIERAFRESDAPGLAVGVVKDMELVYAGGFGVMNRETGGEITPRTLFHMASITKPFVATSIVQLLEQEKLSLDDRIVDYLPYFEMKDERYDTLTIRQFLTHSSGMPNAVYMIFQPCK